MFGFTKSRRLLATSLAVTAMIAAACGGGSGSDGAAGSDADAGSDGATTTATAEQPIITTAADNSNSGDDETGEADAVEPASGTLRMVEFSAVSTFDPAAAQAAQAAYLYPVYDTLTLQGADYTVQPNLATSWESPEPGVWEFVLRDDAVFHDGTPFDAQAAADNMVRYQEYEGNPNAAVWSNMTSATAVDDTTLRVEFSRPQPQFPLEMSMVMGMMVSPSAFESDMTRAPAGSGPWIWQDSESQAGVTEVYTLAPDYWNPAHQGVERVEVTAVPDNSARLNAVLTEEADIVATLRDADAAGARDAGFEVISVPNYLPFIIIYGRDGAVADELADTKVRQAIMYSIDRDAYSEAIQLGNGDSLGGIYPKAFGEWHVPELDDSFQYDPVKAKELLTEAGYPDGITIGMPVMPAISPALDLIVQMLGASGITVELTQINNGELAPRVTASDPEWGLTWNRALLYHPANDLPVWVNQSGRLNPSRLDDNADLEAMLEEAAVAPDLATAQALYAEVEVQLIERGVIIPLAHGAQNAAYDPAKVSGVVMGLSMQAPMPYGVRLVTD